MQETSIISSISKERFQPYLNRCSGNQSEALKLYQKNIEVSQAFYAPLSVLEVTLRNKIDDSFKRHFNSEEWLTNALPPELLKPVVEIEIRLNRSKKNTSNSRILAELNFGFWTTLFNRQYAKVFWKPLHQIFQDIPSEKRKRNIVSARLNHIRNFRNRIYHYEPVIWDLSELKKIKNEIEEVTKWLDSSTSQWVSTFDSFYQKIEN